MLFIVIISILITHATIVGHWLYHFNRLSVTGSNHINATAEKVEIEPLTIVVACKNEAHRLEDFIKGVVHQTVSAVEIIVVDDNSTDATLHLARQLAQQSHVKITVIANKGRGKKAAIRTGIDNTQTTWVITTDADVLCPENWLESMGRSIASHADGKLGAIAGPVRIMNGGIESIDFAAMMGWAASTSLKGETAMASAANLAFRVDLYPRKEQMHPEIESGDDVFAVHAIIENGHKVCWSHDFNSCVETHQAEGWVHWLRQRVRWGAKAKYYNHNVAFRTSMWVAFVASTQMFILLLFVTRFASLTEVLMLWCGRALIDINFTKRVTNWYRIRTNAIDWLILSIIYPLQVPAVFIFGLINKPKWK
ncbi:MAG: glycosyltransferase [Flavobacteriales bacterium]|nr:glycosyltransferase [Flavobacteriales bacterium]